MARHKTNQLISGKLHVREGLVYSEKFCKRHIMGLCLAKIKERYKGVGIALKNLKNVSSASHIFMKSSLMADILNKSNFYLTFSFSVFAHSVTSFCFFDELSRFLIDSS